MWFRSASSEISIKKYLNFVLKLQKNGFKEAVISEMAIAHMHEVGKSKRREQNLKIKQIISRQRKVVLKLEEIRLQRVQKVARLQIGLEQIRLEKDLLRDSISHEQYSELQKEELLKDFEILNLLEKNNLIEDKAVKRLYETNQFFHQRRNAVDLGRNTIDMNDTNGQMDGQMDAQMDLIDQTNLIDQRNVFERNNIEQKIKASKKKWKSEGDLIIP